MSRELTDKEKQRIKKLVFGNCANYRKDYGCLPLECDCYMFTKHFANDKICRYFRDSVLPLDPELEAVFFDKHLKSCKHCGNKFEYNGRNLSLLKSAIERLKKKKETLFDMRTEGEITKEEFVQQKDKLDREILDLETEYYEKSKLAEESKADEPCWDKIIAALNEMIDFSKPELDREVYEKFVSRIVPDGKNKFRWYLNLRDDEDYEVDAEVEGRKNRAVVTFDEVADNLPGYGSVISINELRKTQTPDRIRTLHRQLLRDKGNLLQKTDNLSLKLVDMSLTKDFAFEYIKTKSMVDHFKLSKWQDMNIGVYI